MSNNWLTKLLALALVGVSVFAFNIYEENETLVSKNRYLSAQVSQLENKIDQLENEVDYYKDLNSSTSSRSSGPWTAERVRSVHEGTTYGPTVYVSRTGTKYHSNPSCGNMSDPWVMSMSEAIDIGREPCSKCY